MKRMTAFILALLLAACAIPFTAAADKAVTVDGVTQKLNWDNMFIKDGNMVITMKGFDQVGGEKFGNLSVLIGDEEIIAYAVKDIGDGKCDYSFTGCKALPDVIVFWPDDGSDSRILIWKDSESNLATLPGSYTGNWEGIATPKDGSPEFVVFLRIDFDGRGNYKYMTEERGALVPFHAKLKGNEITAKVEADIPLPVKELTGTLVKREEERLIASFEKAIGDGYKKFIMFLHYPPTNVLEKDSAFTRLASRYDVLQVIYAHCHGKKRFFDSIQGKYRGREYSLVSGDYLNWVPKKIM